uniref:Uncharacterized protein n=1 Tax=Arundo donax TaxID=35708 RepID=A0A0A8Y9B0_ARUDO
MRPLLIIRLFFCRLTMFMFIYENKSYTPSIPQRVSF